MGYRNHRCWRGRFIVGDSLGETWVFGPADRIAAISKGEGVRGMFESAGYSFAGGYGHTRRVYGSGGCRD
jgi:hypothetical protein